MRRAVLLAWALACAAGLATAQTYPSRPVTLITPVPPGGAVDQITRAWMACAETHSGQPFLLQHRPGANGIVATALLRQAPADGHTLLVTGMSQMTIVPFLSAKPPFDPEKDLKGAAIFATSPYLLVASAQSGIRTLQDLAAQAQANPKGIDIGIPNLATPAHLLSAALADHLGLRATLVPTRGEAGGITALLGGHLPLMVFVPGTVAAHIASDKLVPLLAFTAQRLEAYPSVPTVVEALGTAELARSGWLGLSARSDTPLAIVEAVESWTRACLDTPSFRDALTQAMVTPRFASQADMSAWVRQDIAHWKPWIARLNLLQPDEPR